MRFQEFRLLSAEAPQSAWLAPAGVRTAIGAPSLLPTSQPPLAQALAAFDAIDLAQMQHVSLLDRAETKFMLHRQALSALLPTLQADYKVLVVAGVRSIGVGFGLFAIFSVLRYRTSAMSSREMTYLFTLIALPVMNSSLMRVDAWPALLGANAVVVTVLFWLEHEWGFHYESAKSIRYERIELIKPENHALLLADLQARTGLPIKRVEIGRINFLDDSAEMKIYYDEPRAVRASADELVLALDEV
jgi:hypothetical protein